MIFARDVRKLRKALGKPKVWKGRDDEYVFAFPENDRFLTFKRDVYRILGIRRLGCLGNFKNIIVFPDDDPLLEFIANSTEGILLMTYLKNIKEPIRGLGIIIHNALKREGIHSTLKYEYGKLRFKDVVFVKEGKQPYKSPKDTLGELFFDIDSVTLSAAIREVLG